MKERNGLRCFIHIMMRVLTHAWNSLEKKHAKVKAMDTATNKIVKRSKKGNLGKRKLEPKLHSEMKVRWNTKQLKYDSIIPNHESLQKYPESKEFMEDVPLELLQKISHELLVNENFSCFIDF